MSAPHALRADAFPPTRRQMDLLRWIAGYVEARGRAPLAVEMAAGVGLRGIPAVFRLLNGMEQRGLIRRGYRRARSVELLINVVVPRGPDGAAMQFIPVGRLGHDGMIHNGDIGHDHG